MIVITSGQKYSDIDIVACALPLKSLYGLQGVPAQVVLPGPLNESVTKSVRALLPPIQTELEDSPESCQFIMVDVSEPKHFAKFVVEEKVVKLFDHRFWGMENYWKEKLGPNAVIEPVGACATLIWEEYQKSGLESKIKSVDANLMYTAITTHTLNLKSSVTTGRDVKALNSLKSLISLPENFLEIYYDQVNESFIKNPAEAMRNDTKIQEINGKEYGIIQVELWDSRKFIENHKDLVLNTLTSLEIHPEENHPEGVTSVGLTLRVNPLRVGTFYSFLTSPSISEGRNYLVTQNEEVKRLLEKAIGAKFTGSLGVTPNLLLRKEIIKFLSQLP